MNIFYLDKDVQKCAEMHVDKHCVKMILEYAQLLSTTHRVLDGILTVGVSKSGRKQQQYILSDERDQNLYSATHINHPSAVWVRQSESHYRWLFSLWVALMDEYTYRYGRTHASARLIRYLNKPPSNIKFGNGFAEPTPAMPDHYKVAGNSVKSYRNYYLGDKQRMFSWKNRPQPTWTISN
jgi:hypothetical protein